MAATGTATAAEDMRHWEDGATLPSSEGQTENTLTRAELDVAFDRIKCDKATRELGVGIEAYIACPEAKEYLYELCPEINSTAVFHDTIEVVPNRDFDVDSILERRGQGILALVAMVETSASVASPTV
jgi:hypothetical protein